MGVNALIAATTGGTNTAFGNFCLDAVTTGEFNSGTGFGCLTNVTSGHRNAGYGINSGISITTGAQNTCMGIDSGGALTTGSNNSFLGFQASPSSNTVSNEITLGNSSISGLRCNVQTIGSLSDGRDKTNVIDLPEGLDFITKLRPVKFKWATRDGNGKDGLYEHGFIAQDLQVAQKESDADYLNMVMDENPDRLEASYGKLVPILVKAIKELSVKVTALEAG